MSSTAADTNTSNVTTGISTIAKLKLKFHSKAKALSDSGSTSKPSPPKLIARRLQSLLPGSSTASPTTPSPATTPTVRVIPPIEPPEPSYVKIRISTWNMHESIPKGELDALLGVVPPYTPGPPSSDPLEIPGLSNDACHPYHIVVVAGQECPTLLGLPMGLGGGMKWDKDRDKESKEKIVKMKDKNVSRPSFESAVSVDQTPIPSVPGTPLQRATSTSKGKQKEREREREAHAAGWSAKLEDYFCHGIGAVEGAHLNINSAPVPSHHKGQANSSSSSSSSSSGLPTTDQAPQTVSPTPSSSKAAPKSDASWKLPEDAQVSKQPGPYVLAVKERLMGMQVVIFIHRHCIHLLEDVSKSTVTAGLIRGRLGNKGGVGISMKFAGKTWLFVNAHLAAHEGKAAVRLANVAKIKSELTVDPFLEPDDPRAMAEDVTDRFDHTFFLGDLNFRLDVTRLHADWLINRKEYARAQEWDQLRNIMKEGKEFVGFKEGEINFPPTFKYDVMRTLKGKSGSKRASRRHLVLSEVEEKASKEGAEDEHDNDAISLLSGFASSFSRLSRASSRESSESNSSQDVKEEGKVAGSALSIAGSVVIALHKAKEKFKGSTQSKPEATAPTAIVGSPVQENAKPPLPVSLTRRISKSAARSIKSVASWKQKESSSREKLDTERTGNTPISPSFQIPSRLTDVAPAEKATQIASSTPAANATQGTELTRTISNQSVRFTEPVKPGSLSRTVSNQATQNAGERNSGELVRTKSNESITIAKPDKPSTSGTVAEGVEKLEDKCSKGVYDTSHKQRVPSWCDRILFKSTVVPPPDPEPVTEEVQMVGPTPSGNSKIAHRISHLFKPLADRVRKDSSSTHTASPSTGSITQTDVHGSVSNRTSKNRNKPLPELPYTMSLDSAIAAPRRSTEPSPTKGVQDGVAGQSRRRANSAMHVESQGKHVLSHGAGIIRASKSTPNAAVTSMLPDTAERHEAGGRIVDSPTAPSHPRRWFHFPQFFATSTKEDTLAPPAPPPVPVVPKPKRRQGDMVVLHYGTLDDAEMQRLEGRSDHRPVIGHYAVYV